MGWRNMFIKIGKGTDESSIELILRFIDHHNNWEKYFNELEIYTMKEEQLCPGEVIELKVIYDEKNDSYWAYLGNYGGAMLTEDWISKYFPSVILYNSSTWPYYDSNWDEWKLINNYQFLKNT